MKILWHALLITTVSFGQSIKMDGYVKELSGQSVSGATISLKKANLNAITGADGFFKIESSSTKNFQEQQRGIFSEPLLDEKYLVDGRRVSSNGFLKHTFTFQNRAALSKPGSNALDTLEVLKAGFRRKAIPLETYTATFPEIILLRDSVDLPGFAGLNVSCTVDDTIPSAIYKMFLKMTELNQEASLSQCLIENKNSNDVTLKFLFSGAPYFQDTEKLITIKAGGRDSINFLPAFNLIQYETLTELKEVQLSVKGSILVGTSYTSFYSFSRQGILMAKDVLILEKEFYPLIAGWVTPHVKEVDELVRYAAFFHADSQMVGYQGSNPVNGFENKQILYSGRVELAAGERKLAATIRAKYFSGAQSVDGAFHSSGHLYNDVIAYLYGNDTYIYSADKVDSGFFSKIIVPGIFGFWLDNTHASIIGKTVGFAVQLNYQRNIAAEQVEAIFNALKHYYKTTYINSPVSYPEGTQRIRLPKDALALSSANCIDGVVLMASALENIGLNPFIVLIKGHAFLAWETWNGSNVVEAVETTMLGSATFEEAYIEGDRKLRAEFASKNFENGNSTLLNIKELRKSQYYPLMKKASGSPAAYRPR